MFSSDLSALLAHHGIDTASLTPTAGGFSHHSAYATVAGQPCVIKAADSPPQRANLRREAAVLLQIGAYGLPAPHLLQHIDNGRWTVLITPAMPGRTGVQTLLDDATTVPALGAALGTALAVIHCAPAPTDMPRQSERASAAIAAVPRLPLSLGAQHVLTNALAHPLWRADHALLHGDAGLHNLLWDGTNACLIDWEWASLGTPAQDIAWAWWTMHWRQVAATGWPALLGAYRARTSLQPTSASAMRALALGQIGSIMTQVAQHPMAMAEWKRRLDWTLSLSFPALS